MKTILAIIITLAFVTPSLAQEATAPVQKQPTIEELSWKAQALSMEFQYLAERQKTVQAEYQKVTEQLKAMQPAQPKPEAMKDQTPPKEKEPAKKK